ncbi:hypothetical protein D4T97_007780 [Siminovitchia acidinfaciens]|uniref:Uncharacterized protein n=1 Tax=Siminovitchia acidinfaciens TaxID=2321395 RepID=A0A429Y1R1_9BACI|nr:hypothetical protein [Siminovitchia acidinfaciens]RST75150.1 hypothetical protein D4T97_007780 [Siminovitchia acidinfaciens]
MDFCGLCNGTSFENRACPICLGVLVDQGKIYDYYDDYSPYMDIDLNKLADGDPQSSHKPECTHLFVCEVCGTQQELKVVYTK